MADAPSSTLVHLQPRELSPAVRGLLASFVPRGARCLVVGHGNRAMRSWLVGHGCRPVEVAASQATRLPFEGESFDAALLIGVLDQLVSPDLAALELRRVLRPGGVLLVTATNLSYWRHRLDRATGATDRPGRRCQPPVPAAPAAPGRLQPGRGGGPGRRLPARPPLRRTRLPSPRFAALPGGRAVPPVPARVEGRRLRHQGLTAAAGTAGLPGADRAGWPLPALPGAGSQPAPSVQTTVSCGFWAAVPPSLA